MIFIKLKRIKGQNYSFSDVHVHVVTWDPFLLCLAEVIYQN